MKFLVPLHLAAYLISENYYDGTLHVSEYAENIDEFHRKVR